MCYALAFSLNVFTGDLCFLLTNKIFFFFSSNCCSHFLCSFLNPNVPLIIFFTIFLCLFFKHIFCVTNVSLVRSFPFPPPSLSCLCNRLYILPHVLHLSFPSVSSFSVLCSSFFPIAPLASHTHSCFLRRPLSHVHSIHCWPSELILHTQWCCLSNGLSLHTHAALLSVPFMYMCRICIFTDLGMHPEIQDFYTCTAFFYTYSFTTNNHYHPVSLFLSVSHRIF